MLSGIIVQVASQIISPSLLNTHKLLLSAVPEKCTCMDVCMQKAATGVTAFCIVYFKYRQFCFRNLTVCT